MLISAFNYICLKGCHPPEMQGCWHQGRLVKLCTFASQAENFINLFEGVAFVSCYKMAEFVVQHMLNCV